MSPRDEQILKLYRAMPGAPPIPYLHGQEMWGDVEGNEQWEFCAAIVDVAIGAAQAYSR